MENNETSTIHTGDLKKAAYLVVGFIFLTGVLWGKYICK